MNRKYIRKLVLQEFRNRLVEQEEKKQKSFPNIEAAQQAKEELEKNADLLAEGVPPVGLLVTELCLQKRKLFH